TAAGRADGTEPALEPARIGGLAREEHGGGDGPAGVQEVVLAEEPEAGEAERPELGDDDLAALEAHRAAPAVKDPAGELGGTRHRLGTGPVDGDGDRGSLREQAQ